MNRKRLGGLQGRFEDFGEDKPLMHLPAIEPQFLGRPTQIIILTLYCQNISLKVCDFFVNTFASR